MIFYSLVPSLYNMADNWIWVMQIGKWLSRSTWRDDANQHFTLLKYCHYYSDYGINYFHYILSNHPWQDISIFFYQYNLSTQSSMQWPCAFARFKTYATEHAQWILPVFNAPNERDDKKKLFYQSSNKHKTGKYYL